MLAFTLSLRLWWTIAVLDRQTDRATSGAVARESGCHSYLAGCPPRLDIDNSPPVASFTRMLVMQSVRVEPEKGWWAGHTHSMPCLPPDLSRQYQHIRSISNDRGRQLIDAGQLELRDTSSDQGGKCSPRVKVRQEQPLHSMRQLQN